MRWPLPFACVLAIACSSGGGPSTESLAWKALPDRYARCFQVFANGSARKVIVFGDAGRSDTIGVYLLRGEDAAGDGAAVYLPDLQRVAVLSTTHLSFISALSRTDLVVAATYLDQVRDQATRERIKQGLVIDIGAAEGIDRERLFAANAQVVFDYPFGQATHRGAVPEQVFVPVTEYLEDHPLGRAEWIRFFGVLFDEEERADSLFAAIEARYLQRRRESNELARPTVLFGSYWQGQWFVPPGNSYMAHLIEDAGGRYLFADRTGSGNITLDMETMVSEGLHADVWGMIAEVDGVPTEDDFTHRDPRLAGFKAVREKKLFIGNVATSDLFGQAMLEPDILLSELQEMIAIHAAFDHAGGYRPKYFAHPGPELGVPDIAKITVP